MASPVPASGSRSATPGAARPAVAAAAAPSPAPTITAKPAAAPFARKLTPERLAAVAALAKAGFGKSAAYAALKPEGRFATRLDFQPGGRIAWKS